MSGQHTPGPWVADATDPSDVVVWASPDPKQNDELIANVGQRIQRVQVAFDCDAANARLIAAAPDLLEALESLIAIDEDTLADGATLQDRVDVAWASAKAAIAKARA